MGLSALQCVAVFVVSTDATLSPVSFVTGERDRKCFKAKNMAPHLK